jgi:hypothetical protein
MLAVKPPSSNRWRMPDFRRATAIVTPARALTGDSPATSA